MPLDLARPRLTIKPNFNTSEANQAVDMDDGVSDVIDVGLWRDTTTVLPYHLPIRIGVLDTVSSCYSTAVGGNTRWGALCCPKPKPVFGDGGSVAGC